MVDALLFIKNMKLRYKFIAIYLLLIISSFCVMGTFLYIGTETYIRSQWASSQYEIIKQLNNNIDKTIDEIKRMTLILSSDQKMQRILRNENHSQFLQRLEEDAVISEKLDEITHLNPYVRGIYLFSNNGSVYQNSHSNSSIRSDFLFTRTRWFDKMKKFNLNTLLLPSYVPDEIISNRSEQKVMGYVHEIKDNNTGFTLGFILVHIEHQLFNILLEEMQLPLNTEMIIIDSGKTIVYHPEEAYVTTYYRSEFISEILKKSTGNLISNDGEKKQMIIYHTSEETEWTIISSIPLASLYSNILNLRVLFVILFLMTGYVAIATGYVFSNNIARPIFKMQKHMSIAEKGDFRHPIPIESNDEIGELSASFNQMIYKIDALIQKNYTMEILKKEAELNALQAQINPHFLYNTLQIIDLTAEDEGVELISHICQKLSMIFRYSISQGKEVVEISKELEHVKSYVYIQKIRFGDKFKVEYDVDEKLMKCKILKLIIQPLIENAIIHGISDENPLNTIKIKVFEKKDIINIYVEDDGKGMDNERLKTLTASLDEEMLHAEIYEHQKQSIGIKNVHLRIKLYFGENYGIKINSLKGIGTQVSIGIPKIQ